MKTVLLTGGIGSGKSAVRHILEGMGIPCYDADSAVKSFYSAPESGSFADSGSFDGNSLIDGSLPGDRSPRRRPFLLPALENALGVSLRDSEGKFNKKALSSLIFSDPEAMAKVEGIVFPALVEDFSRWKAEAASALASPDGASLAPSEAASSSKAAPASADCASRPSAAQADFVVFESATALDKPAFPRIWDSCLWVDAPEEIRIQRVISRDACSREAVLSRLRLQSPLESHRSEVDWVIENDCSLAELRCRVEEAIGRLRG